MKIERHTIVKLYKIVTNKRKFVLCPVCESQGKINVLGEITEDGAFEILRFHQGRTKIIADELKIVCGNCGEVVYFKTIKNEEKKADCTN